MTARAPFAFLYADRGGQIFLSVVLLLAVLVPLLNLALPVELRVPCADSWVMSLLGKYLCFALLALSVDLIWGFCGILSLGHGAFFALGGYAMGMYLMRQIGDRGVYGNPELPDFMVFLNWKELPWYWHGFDNFWLRHDHGVAGPRSCWAFVFGWLTFRSRVTGVYLSIISQAMTYALLLAFFRNDMGFGGNNGLTDFKDLLGFDLQASETRAGLFAGLGAGAGRRLSPVPMYCRHPSSAVYSSVSATRRSRARFLGYRVEHYKLFVFTLSAMLAGVAGALYVPQVGIINPERVRAGRVHRDCHLGRDRRARLACMAQRLGPSSSTTPRLILPARLPEIWLFIAGGACSSP